jgi:two-component system OmpR family sensor kinase
MPAGPPPVTAELPAPPRRSRLWLRSLTSRLVVGVVALVVLIVAAIGSATYYFLRSYLLNRLDQQVISAAQQNAQFFDRCLYAFGRCPPGSPPVVHEWIKILNVPGGARYTFSGPNISSLSLSPDAQNALQQDPSQMLTLYSNGQKLRVAGEGQAGVVVVTGLSTNEVDTTLARLVFLEVLIGGVAVLIALGATSWGVRRSLRNLYQVTGTAQEVAAELSPTGTGLDRRVPVTEEGTEVGQLAESMNTLLAAVETQFAARLESEHRLRQFLADASHELRTPLTSIRGYAELARMQRAAGDSQHDNLDRIESEGTRMSRLVDDLLLLARGDAEEPDRADAHEPVDLADLLDDAVSGSRAAFPERPIYLDISAVPVVLGDRDQLLRVVRNLITNAAVHTEAGRPIHVRGFTDAGGAVITVADGGPGLPPEQAAHVFERFWRADKARTRARGGSGLGLSIVAAIVRAHAGSVRFDSTVEGGSTVTVWLPAASQ